MTAVDLESRIAGLASLSREELIACWSESYSCAPPKGLSRRLLLRAIAYEMQAKKLGGLKSAARRRLQAIAGDTLFDDAPPASSKSSAPVLKPGTRLIREWNGVTHSVEVTGEGFLWNGASYASLSAVARAITGARWSGPRFFALNGAGSS